MPAIRFRGSSMPSSSPSLAQCPGAWVGPSSAVPRQGVLLYTGPDRMTLGLVGVLQAVRRAACLSPPASFQPRFTASCTPVLRPCPPWGGCHVGGVARDQHPTRGGRTPLAGSCQ